MDTQPPQPAAADDLLFGPYCLDGRQGLLLRDGADIPLTPKLVDTLRALAEAGGHLVPKETLITRVWPDTAVTDNSLTQNIWLLRRAIEHEGERYIETIPRRGYRLTVPVTVRPAPGGHNAAAQVAAGNSEAAVNRSPWRWSR
jgi:DNA-binding winged helix-turn-helix (wHTH) protein